MLHSERKIEVIEERLARIESLLENLTSLSTTIQQHPGPSEATPRIAVAQAAQTSFSTPNITPKAENITQHATPRGGGGNSDANTTDTAAAFEGASSLSAHSVHATSIIENAMNSDYAVFSRNPEMQDALFALRHLIEKQQQHASPGNHDYRFPNQHVDASSVDFSSTKMPRLESVVSFLRLSKGEVARTLKK